MPGTCRVCRLPRVGRPDTSALGYSTKCLDHAQALVGKNRRTLFFQAPRGAVVPPGRTLRCYQRYLRANMLRRALEYGSLVRLPRPHNLLVCPLAIHCDFTVIR
jgi:hypothetical protein